MSHENSLNYIQEIDNAFDSEFCKSIVKRKKENGLPPYEDVVYWKEKDIYKDWAFLMDDLDKLSKPFIERYLAQFNTAIYEDLSCDGFGVNRQPPGVFDKFHYDTNVSVTGSKIFVRPFVLLIYLNEGFSGGQLMFPNQKKIIEPKEGKLLFFPCSFMYPHMVATFSGEDRYILRMCYSFKSGVIDADLDYWDTSKLGVQKRE